MNTGTLLKQKLGLDNFPYVKYQKVLLNTNTLFLIYYDTRRPDYPITNRRLKTMSTIHILRGYQNDDFIITPAYDLHEFDGNLENRIIIAFDLAGSNFTRPEKLTSPELRGGGIKVESFILKSDILYERTNCQYKKLLEGYTIPDLRKNAFNAHELKFYKLRMKANNGITLKDISWNDRNTRGTGDNKYSSTLTLTFSIVPTYFSQVSILSKDGTPSKADHYTFKLQFQDINKWIGSRKEFLELSESDKVEFMKAIMKKAEVKLWSNDYSWLFQGNYENAVNLDYSLYPWPVGIPKAEGRWALIKTGDTNTTYYSLSKHAIEVLKKVHLMTKAIIKRIKDTYK